MVRFLLTVAVLSVPLLGLVASEDGARKLPLDLPSGGGGFAEDEEDAPEIITFYGHRFEGNAFFWCFPAYEM